DGERTATASELFGELLELVAPAARELGSTELLEALDPSRCEGDRQLEVARSRGLEGVVADVAERTLGSLPCPARRRFRSAVSAASAASCAWAAPSRATTA